MPYLHSTGRIDDEELLGPTGPSAMRNLPQRWLEVRHPEFRMGLTVAALFSCDNQTFLLPPMVQG